MSSDLLSIMPDYLQDIEDFASHTFPPWVMAILGTIVVGLTGLVPLIIIPLDAGPSLIEGNNSRFLKLLLSFAVGSLLGDVFLHLLPESYAMMAHKGADNHDGHLNMGLWILGGMLCFLVLEKVFEFTDETPAGNNNVEPTKNKKIVGYLNLLANCIDNFMHGLAVASSFLTSTKLGFVTTFAILIHEIPHEIGDFAILLKSGFSRWDAGKAQFWTAGMGMMGAILSISLDSESCLEARTAWILPFSAGGFLNIALVSILPELLNEKDPKESLKQLCCIILGIISMGALATV